MGGQQQGSSEPGGKSASSAASASSAINFGNSGLVNESGGLTPLSGVILGAVALLAFIGMIIVGRK